MNPFPLFAYQPPAGRVDAQRVGVRMLGNLVYDEVLTSMNWPFASSLAIVLLCITGAVMIGYLRTMQRLTARGRAA